MSEHQLSEEQAAIYNHGVREAGRILEGAARNIGIDAQTTEESPLKEELFSAIFEQAPTLSRANRLILYHAADRARDTLRRTLTAVGIEIPEEDALEQRPVAPQKPTPVGTMSWFLRSQLGLSLRETGRRAGISSMHLSRIENLQAQPTEDKIRGLARTYGVSMNTMFGMDVEPNP